MRVELVYIDLANKPADFLAMAEPVGGSVPILRVGGGQVVCGSGDILSHIQVSVSSRNIQGGLSPEGGYLGKAQSRGGESREGSVQRGDIQGGLSLEGDIQGRAQSREGESREGSV